MRATSRALRAAVLEADLTWTGREFERNVRVVVEGDRIGAVFRGADEAALGPAPTTTDRLSGLALVPGLVNCHSHAFQRGLRGKGETYPPSDETSSFWTWRRDMYSLVEQLDEEGFYNVTRQCFEEMRASGITTTGEFHYFHHDTFDDAPFRFDDVVLRAARDTGIRLVLLNTFYAFGGFGEASLSPSQERFKTSSLDAFWEQMDALSERLDPATQSLGVVAHSLRAVSVEQLRGLFEGAKSRSFPFHLHLEEQPKEVEDCRAEHSKTPMRLLLDNIKVDESVTAVHCTHTTAEDMDDFVRTGANVCICPLTEGNLGDGFPPLVNCAGNICLGTDCNARIDMLEEMRWLEYAHRLNTGERGVCVQHREGEDQVGRELFGYATTKGARSLQQPVGEIRAGCFADFATIDLSSPILAGCASENLAEHLIFGSSAEAVVHSTCVGGEWRAASGIHAPLTSTIN